jgi:hypothetical protein
MNNTRLQMLFQTIDALNADELQQVYCYILENRVQFTCAQVTMLAAPPIPADDLTPPRHSLWKTPSPDDDYYDTSWEGES